MKTAEYANNLSWRSSIWATSNLRILFAVIEIQHLLHRSLERATGQVADEVAEEEEEANGIAHEEICFENKE